MTRSAAAWWALAGYALFVVYGSLVPLDHQTLPPGEAWRRFQQIPWLDLGAGSRADWVANGVLYLPLGFLAARALRGVLPAGRWLAPPLALALCWATAVAVEFTQLSFPPRTVSLNDLVAEGLGSALGVVLAGASGAWLARLARAWAAGGDTLRLRLLEVYALAWLALSFFPYDLLLSAAELADKAASALWHPLLVVGERGTALAVLQLGVEAALAAPLGALLQLRFATRPGGAAVAGAAVGALVEIGQFFVLSGFSQGASVASRAVGFALGAAAVPWVAAQGLAGLRQRVRVLSPWLALPYLALLLFAAGWLRQGLPPAVRDGPALAAAWAEQRWVPFYYHYYTTEAVALFSLGSVALMFLPLALAGWAGRWRPALTLAVVGALAAVVEAGKLFIAPLHPDPTNLPIALAACAALLALLDWLTRRSAAADSGGPARGLATPAAPTSPADSAPTGPVETVAPPPPAAAHPASPHAGWPWALVAACGLASLFDFPVFRAPLLAFVVVAALVVAWRPVLALALIPAALPLLDLAPWSGRLFWTEFDALLLVLLGVAAWRVPPPAGRVSRDPGLAAAGLLLGVSYGASTLHALWPWPGLDDNSFSSLLSPFNTLRVAKGALAAWAFIALLGRIESAQAAGGAVARRLGPPAAQALVGGTAAGLALTVLWIAAERWAFVGLFDLAADYRVTGPFSAMQRGGAFIECYLAVAAAAALALARGSRGRLRVAGWALLAAAGWATMLTFSRNGWAAFALVLAGGALLALLRRPPAAADGPALPGAASRRSVRWVGTVAGVALVAAAALPVLFGSYAQQRLAQTSSDLGLRTAHWSASLALREPGLAAALLGEGPGRFAERHFWRSVEGPRAGSYALRRDADGRRLLRLGPGAPLYIEQWLDDAPVGPLRLSAQLRAADGRSRPSLGLSLCRKSTLTSVGCTGATLAAAPDAAPGPAGWFEVRADLHPPKANPPAREGWLPAKFALHTPAQAPAIDVRGVSVVDAAGREWIVNGDFAAGIDRWFFVTDTDPPWHLHSLPLTVWLELGWLGVVAWTAFVAAALAGWFAALRTGTAAWPEAGLAALALLASGMLNTLIDEPRFLALALVALALAARRPAQAPRRSRRRKRGAFAGP